MKFSRKNSNLLNWTSCGVVEQKLHANIVMCIFYVAHGGRRDHNQHLRSQKHKDGEKTVASAKNISSFMVRRDGDSESDKIAASEALDAYHIVRYGQRFRANDCLSAYTKSGAIITNVLSPNVLDEIIEDLNKTKTTTVSLDASNGQPTFSNPCVVLLAKLWCSRQNYRPYFHTW
jgi:hypothetical protein